MAFNRDDGAHQTGEQEGGTYFVKKEMLLDVTVKGPQKNTTHDATECEGNQFLSDATSGLK